MLCDCGKIFDCTKGSVRCGNTTSCGCRRIATLKTRLTTHGLSSRGSKKHPLYGTWSDLKKRVYNDSCASYRNYGGRGIKLCDRWHDFLLFLADVGDKPGPEWSLDRIDVNGDYSPDNCRWATDSTQANNRRDSLRYLYEGQLYTKPELVAIAAMFGVKYGTLHARLSKGVPVKEAVETSPVRSRVRLKFKKDSVARIGVLPAYPNRT